MLNIVLAMQMHHKEEYIWALDQKSKICVSYLVDENCLKEDISPGDIVNSELIAFEDGSIGALNLDYMGKVEKDELRRILDSKAAFPKSLAGEGRFGSVVKIRRIIDIICTNSSTELRAELMGIEGKIYSIILEDSKWTFWHQKNVGNISLDNEIIKNYLYENKDSYLIIVDRKEDFTGKLLAGGFVTI